MSAERIITADHIADFSAYLKIEEKSGATVEKYIRDVRAFMLYADGRTIDKQLVLDYKKELLEKYMAASANSMLAALNSFFRYMGCQTLCVRQFRVQQQVYCPKEKELTRQEYVRLVRCAEKRHDQRLALALQTICGTGIRVSELKYVTVEAVKRGEAVVSCKGKTRVILIVSELRKKLLTYVKHCGIKSGAVFITSGGRPLDRSNLWRDMKRLCELAGVTKDKVFPHNLRHLFARTFYNAEKDIAKLADILGHSNINTTRIYIITTYAEHRRYMENMCLIL